MLVVFALALMVPVSAIAAPTVRTMFVDAILRERAVRVALADPAVSTAVLKSVRQVLASYESFVRRYPTSAYSDDALWQAGRLALDVFAKFGEGKDRDSGVRMLRWLAAEYPSSKFVKQVPDLLSATSGAGRGVTSAVQPAPARGSSLDALSPSAKPKASPSSVVAKAATLTHIQRSLLPDVIRVTIALDAEVPFHDERIADPTRIFIDFPATHAVAALNDRTLQFDDDRDLVRHVRIGRQPNATTRVVLDAAGISSYSVYPVYNPYRLIIDCVRATPGPSSVLVTAVAPPGTNRPVLEPARPKPGVSLDPLRPAPDRIAEMARAKPAAAAAAVLPRVNVPIAGRRLAAPWAGTLPVATPNATALLAAARLPLSSHTITNVWGQRLPNPKPGTTAAFFEQARTIPSLASRAVAAPLLASVPRVVPSPLPSVAPPVLPSVPTPPAAATAEAPATTPEAASTVNAAASPALPALPSAPPTPGLGSGFSMARQLGLGVSRIVIDPGHGGHDPGAKGKGGITEAELVLDVSVRLEKLLAKIPGLEVILTRHGDDFVSLPERTAIANREGADLFLSIHANASPNDQAHGVETYFLNFANNLSAAAVAARENATSGQAMGALPDFVRAIALNNKLDESRDFATLVQQSMVERLRPTNKTIRDLGVKQAPFVVLIGASMPSVLAEISFLTHEQEAKLLKSSAYRDRIAEALFDAVRQYQGSLQRVQTVAHQ
ncbi:MAG: N-acetylmuramoyl-L-alanine amidase [Acidobacteriota bacterium]